MPAKVSMGGSGKAGASQGGSNPDAKKGIIAGVVALLAVVFLAWYFLRPAPNPGEIGNTAGGSAAPGGAPAAGQMQPAGMDQPMGGVARLPGSKGKSK
jgi:hypothetical protein